MNNAKEAESLFNLYMDNPYWKEYYDTAPSKGCKDYIELNFTADAYDDEEYKQKRIAIMDTLLYADWEHLYKYAGNNPFKSYCKQRMEETKCD